MPTGYTAAVEDGTITTLEEFAILCARAFGATIAMRDEPLDKPIPERFEPDTSYHDEKIREAEERIEQLHAMSPAQCAIAADADFVERLVRHEAYLAEQREKNARHRAMLDQVLAWKVEEKIAGLRNFMIDQLEMSFSDYTPDTPVCLSWNDWQRTELAQAMRDITYHTKQRDEEIKRTEERNEWLAALRQALQPKPPKGQEKRMIQL